MTTKKIGIIGAGIAGLSCAKQLISAGFDVKVFDKSRGVGGRMSHRVFDQWHVDHGAQYFTATHSQFVEELQEWLTNGAAQEWNGKIVNFCDGQFSEKKNQTKRYVGVPAMTAPAKFLAKNISVFKSQTIIELRKNQKKWQLISEESGVLTDEFDYLIFAIPPIQAKKIIGQQSASLSLICEQANMLPCWTLLAYFKEPLALPFDAAFVQDNVFSWIARDNSKPGRDNTHAWVAQANPNWSLKNIDLNKLDAQKILLQEFEKISGAVSDFNQIQLWRYAKLASPSTQNFAIDANTQLALCGDWLCNSKVEDAWLSGYFLGSELKRMLITSN